MIYQHYIGIDYSGAQTPESRIKSLQVYRATQDDQPVKISTSTEGAKNWSRLEVAQYCLQTLESSGPVIIGIDHAFSFPLSYMQRYGLNIWDEFLDDFMRHWPTADPDSYVEEFREGNSRSGDPTELRFCERWTASAKSVFQFDVQGSVAKSTHAGLPWLLWLREAPGIRSSVRFWPFDGFDVPDRKSVIAEIYPSLYRRRFPVNGRSVDEYDAWSVAAWLREADRRGTLENYFVPPLTLPERKQAELEGWILGVW